MWWSDRCLRAAPPACAGAFSCSAGASVDAAAETLEPIAAEHDRVDPLDHNHETLEQSRSTNTAIAKAIADVRSSSAVLAEVRRLVPDSIALDRLQVKGNVMEISGAAEQPNGLRLVNALLLRLSASGFFDPQQVKLSRANVAGQDEESKLKFSVAAGFAPDAALSMRTFSRGLAPRMARRIAVLEREGLVK